MEATPVTAKTALVVIDVQVGMFDEADPVYKGDALLATIRTLIAKAREAGAPVVFVRHQETEGPLVAGTPAWQVHPALGPAAGDILVDKWTPDSFHETTLQQELAERGIKRLVLTGIQTDLCVDTTCRRAFSLGYEVALVKDAHSTWPSGNLSAQQIIDHHNGALRWFAKTQEAAAVTF